VSETSLQPVGFPHLEALLAHAGKEGWQTYLAGNYSPQSVLLTLGPAVPPHGIRLGRLWLNVSLLSAGGPSLAAFVPARFLTATSGPAIPIEQARQAGFTFVEIVRETKEVHLASDFAASRSFHEALITEVAIPPLDASSKDPSKMRIRIDGISYTPGPPAAEKYVIAARNLTVDATASVTLLRSP